LFKVRMTHIERDAELEVLETYRDRRDRERADLPRVARGEVIDARVAIDAGIFIHPKIKECLVDLARAIRDDERVLQGNSTRSLVLALPALQVRALLNGRTFVSGEDVEALMPRVLGHRIELVPGLTAADEVIADVLRGPLERLSAATLSRSTHGLA
jgi:MoxR-like ATPase